MFTDCGGVSFTKMSSSHTTHYSQHSHILHTVLRRSQLHISTAVFTRSVNSHVFSNSIITCLPISPVFSYSVTSIIKQHNSLYLLDTVKLKPHQIFHSYSIEVCDIQNFHITI